MSEKGFSKDFLWGAATASAQIEGGFDEDGRTPSIWDAATKKQIKHGEDCHTACDHYHKMKEDVALMKQIGLKAYRFSVSWSRVIPTRGVVNENGLQFYSDLINELIANGIEPLITIYHWDMPVWAYKKGGWLSKSIVEPFCEYTKVLVDAFSDRVKYWLPFNEPSCFLFNGYVQGVHAPFKRNPLNITRLTKNFMLACSEATKVIREFAKQPVKIGVAFATSAVMPKSDSAEDVEYARKNTVEEGCGLLSNRWFMDPLILGKGVSAYGVYRISEAFAKKVQTKFDFMGINSYSPLSDAGWLREEKPVQGTARNCLGWITDERILYWTPKFLYEKYKLPIMVTENGLGDNDARQLDGKVHDSVRADYVKRHLSQLKSAADSGVPVLGYMYWSLLDNFEWAEGYDPRFGLIYVNYQTQERTIKDSAYEYKKIIENNGANV